MLELADWGFYLFHTLFIGFNMFGWIWRRTRVWHLATLGVTTFSWFALGAFYGWGYCLCTDWHFQIRRRLDYADTESSYVQLIAKHGLGITISPKTSDIIAGSVFLLIVLATAIVWSRDLLRRRKARLQNVAANQL